MKTNTKLGMLVAAVAMAASGAAFSADAPANPYVQASGKTLTTNYGLCVRTGYWTPALAEAQGALGQNCQCDADIVKCAEKVTLSADALFGFDKAGLSADGKKLLKELTSRMSGLTIDGITIKGYADRIGSAGANERISLRRANAVKAYMQKLGVDAKIQTEGMGSADPVVDCPNPSAKGEIKTFGQLVKCLQPNRRAVVEVQGVR